MSNIINGKEIAAKIVSDIKVKTSEIKSKQGRVPGLAVILVGENPASKVYVTNKIKQTIEAGMNSFEFKYDESISQNELLQKIKELNLDDNIHGILVQLPLPKHIDEFAVINSISPEKDVDGFSVNNVGKMVIGLDALMPCTPVGCIELIKRVCPDLSGKKAIVIGRSNIVGKPVAMMLLQNNATVTIAHSKTINLEEEVKMADIVIAAVGIPHFVKGSWIKKGAIVIDVGINRILKEDGTSKLVGDVDYEEAAKNASYITPVPGGVGPMTIACLLKNTLKAFENKYK